MNYKMINLEIISIMKKEDISGYKEYKIVVNYVVEVVKPKPPILFFGQRLPSLNSVPNEVGDRLNFKGWLVLVKEDGKLKKQPLISFIDFSGRVQ